MAPPRIATPIQLPAAFADLNDSDAEVLIFASRLACCTSVIPPPDCVLDSAPCSGSRAAHRLAPPLSANPAAIREHAKNPCGVVRPQATARDVARLRKLQRNL